MGGRKWRGLTPDDMPGQGEEQRCRRLTLLKFISTRPRTTREITILRNKKVGRIPCYPEEFARDLSNVRSDLCALRHRGLVVKVPRGRVERGDRWILG